MASRSTANTPVVVSIALLGLLVVVMFVLSVVFFAKSRRLATDLQAAQDNLRVAVRDTDPPDRWEALKAEAGRANMSVVGYLDQTRQQAIRAVTSSPRDTIEQMQERIKAAGAGEGQSLLAVLGNRDAEISRLNANLEEARQSLAGAQEELARSDEKQRVMRDEMLATIVALQEEVQTYRDRAEGYGQEVQGIKTVVQERDDVLEEQYLTQIRGLEDQVADLLDENQILAARVQSIEAKSANTTLSPRGEATLVDARVVGVDAGARTVYLDIGRQQRAILGMTFEVYGNQVDIAPDANGEYPYGKATVEITRVDDTTSVGRIIRENRGNPIVRGDVLANAVYDPAKVYSFVVFGNFDRNNDGVATLKERQQVESDIAEWGGRISEDLDGSTDFLVLGQRPLLPPQPRPDDPVELTVAYANARNEQVKYDNLFESARRTGIPILNQNRLFTLTGLHARR